MTMSQEQVSEELKQLGRQNSALAMRYQGEVQMFNAAAVAGNGKLMDQHRSNVHAAIDEMLDMTARIYALAYQGMANG